MTSRPHAIIIGAGFTGVATAHDLALRGFNVTVFERGDLCNGTSGRTHGLLYCSGRYAVKDPESAVECIEENPILRKIVPQVKETFGIEGFVTITGGKATTLRAMAEKTADAVCAKMGIQKACLTRDTPLLSYRQYYTQLS